MRSSYITVIFVVSLASVDGDEELEILPNPEPLASPERSAIDEQKFNVGFIFIYHMMDGELCTFYFFLDGCNILKASICNPTSFGAKF